jgi:hypothetical protein
VHEELSEDVGKGNNLGLLVSQSRFMESASLPVHYEAQVADHASPFVISRWRYYWMHRTHRQYQAFLFGQVGDINGSDFVEGLEPFGLRRCLRRH